MNDPMNSAQPKVELAVLVDVGEPFVQGIYKLEGGGLLALCAYQKIVHYTSALHLPNTQTIT